MSLCFLPDVLIPAITDITVPMLQARSVRLLMLDYDNTIVPYTTDIPTQRVLQWLLEMNSSEIQICIVSNSRNNRVVEFCRQYGLDCIVRAQKPGTKGIRQCLAQYGIPAAQAALVGDQIYTDTLGANRAGVQAILVNAINNHNFWLKARHALEIPFILAAEKRRVIK